ncbi:MAG: phage tail sheath family protein [Kineosporiaceae bacterium]|nr:phage tail sheath family protein [Kineosporiaceae bacterium]
MTVTPTYPGVYIREIPSGSRTITGVATSITAFLGTARRGPVDEPVPIFGFGDFERTFGGLWRESGLGYAVRDFFTNGGSSALVVRIVHHDDEDDETDDVAAAPALITLPTGDDTDPLVLEATGPGAWANPLEVEVTHPAEPDASDIAGSQGVAPTDLFTLVIREGPGEDAASETFRNVTTVDGPNRLDLALASSTLVQVQGTLPTDPPTPRPAAGLHAVAHVDVDGLHLVARDAAAWSPGFTADVTHPAVDDAEAITAAAEQEVTVEDLFSLTLTAGDGDPEEYPFVTVIPGPRRIDAVLAASALARAAALPAARPEPDSYAAPDVNAGLDGDAPTVADYLGSENDKTGMFALLQADLFNILCIPPITPGGDLPAAVWAEAAAFCAERRAFLIVDAPGSATVGSLPGWVTGDAGLSGTAMRNAAVYFPRIRRPDPLRGGASATFAACGAIAGTYARTDGARGVWKAPAGIEAGLTGVVGLPVPLTDDENGLLNPLGINCLRTFRGVGSVIWGARTLRGADILADEYRYIPVRRLALFLEETLYRSTQWVVFEPNDEPLWAQIRLSVGAFLQSLFRQGAFQGTTPREAYFVRCDRDTTTQYDIDRGVVNIIVGFAPLKPAEFVVIGIQQMTASASA